MAQEKVDGSAVIVAGGKTELQYVLDELGTSLQAAEESSKAKDEEITELKRDLAKAEKSAGTRPYLMLEGVLGFDDNLIPEYGVGLTLGARFGNHMMVELGADYKIGSTWQDAKRFGLEDWTFRCGVGWMF